MRRFLVLFVGASLSATLLTGCTNDASSLAKIPVVRDLAASFVAARSFDSATLALRREDKAGLVRASQDLKKADDILSRKQFLEMSLCLTMFSAAWQLETQLGQSKVPNPSLRQEADERYRAAIELLPENWANLDAFSANAMGYFLASRGTAQADFKKAVDLTQEALAKSSRDLEAIPENNPLRAQAEFGRASGSRDSYAWALFRAGRLQEAKKEQQEVLRVLRGSDAQKFTISPEIPFHMAEIYRALGQKADAKREYQAALLLSPDAELTEKINAALKALK